MRPSNATRYSVVALAPAISAYDDDDDDDDDGGGGGGGNRA